MPQGVGVQISLGAPRLDSCYKFYAKKIERYCPGGGMVDTAVLEAAAERRESSSLS